MTRRRTEANAQKSPLRASVPVLQQADLVPAGLLALLVLVVVVQVAALAAVVELLAHLALPALSLVVAVAVGGVLATAWILRRATPWSAAAAVFTLMPSTLILPRIRQPMWAKTASFWSR